jgi:hypothetical protein
MFLYKNIWAHWLVPHNGTTKPTHQPNKKWYTQVSYNQGASKAPPAAPPSGGGGGPPLPAPGGGGGIICWTALPRWQATTRHSC